MMLAQKMFHSVNNIFHFFCVGILIHTTRSTKLVQNADKFISYHVKRAIILLRRTIFVDKASSLFLRHSKAQPWYLYFVMIGYMQVLNYL